MDTFVVRLWTPAPAAGDPAQAATGMHGTAQHVPSGRTATFRDGEELLERLATLAGADPHEAEVTRPAGPDTDAVQPEA